MTETNMTIVENLRFYMERMGMKQSRLASEIGASPMTVSRWMTGKGCPSIAQLERSAKALCIEFSDLVLPREPAAADELTRHHAYECLYKAIFVNEQFVLPDQYAEVADHIMSECLKDLEKEVLTFRYGLDNGGIRALAKIGKQHNLTRERVRQLQEQALERMRNYRGELQINTLVELKKEKQDPESDFFVPLQLVMDGFGEDTPERTECA